MFTVSECVLSFCSFNPQHNMVHTFFLNALLRFVSLLLYIHRDHTDYWVRGAQDAHLFFYTDPELWRSYLIPKL